MIENKWAKNWVRVRKKTFIERKERGRRIAAPYKMKWFGFEIRAEAISGYTSRLMSGLVNDI